MGCDDYHMPLYHSHLGLLPFLSPAHTPYVPREYLHTTVHEQSNAYLHPFCQALTCLFTPDSVLLLHHLSPALWLPPVGYLVALGVVHGGVGICDSVHIQLNRYADTWQFHY